MKSGNGSRPPFNMSLSASRVDSSLFKRNGLSNTTEWCGGKEQISMSEEFHFGGSHAKNSSSILRPTDDESSMI